jgi:FkbM family methyltransferase
VIINTGIIKGIGHFQDDSAKLRAKPFNMITLDEVWDHYDTTTKKCDASLNSYGLDNLDLKILETLPENLTGFFIEVGANDGVSQSNSVLLEKAGWRGMLVEALPATYAKCKNARPNMIVENVACVPFEYGGETVTVTDVGLMSIAVNSAFTDDVRQDWISRGEGFTRRRAQDIEVRAAPLSLLLDKHEVKNVDLLLLDVEGAEISVLEGLDFGRHPPRFIVAEDNHTDELVNYLASKGYQATKILSERAYTRDIFYTRENWAPKPVNLSS